jgi:hypothetical protein
MSRVSAPARLIATIAAALVLPFLALVAPAHADPPIPTYSNVYPYNILDDDTSIGLSSSVYRVGSSLGGIQGTVTFRDDQGNVLAADLPVSPANGYAHIDIPKPTQPTTFYVDFHGTDGFADSTGTRLYTPSFLHTVNVVPEPTIMKITAGSPQLTLTLAAYARFKDGTPAPGVTVYFNGPCLLRDPSRGMCEIPLKWCQAVSDANGLASCQGAGTFASIVSILNGAVYLVAHSYNPSYYVQVPNGTPPLIVRS